MADSLTNKGLTTPWSVILQAQHADSDERRAYLDYLLGLYREPARCFIQARLIQSGVPGHEDDSDDLVQAFFADFLEGDILDRLNPERGSFRSFLRKLLTNHLNDAFRERTRRTGKGVLTRLAYRRPGTEPDANTLPPGQRPDPKALTPEAIFDRACAQRLLADAVEAFRRQCADRAVPHYFAVFERHAWRPEDFGRPDYAASAEALGCSVKDVTNHLHRAKKAFKKVLWERVRQTVATDEDVETELAALRQWFL